MSERPETINIDGQVFRKFVVWPDEADDGAPRCIACGQIDEPEYHENTLCPALSERLAGPPHGERRE